ncbi:hypothetical protein [Novipirellula sp.]|uniref:hypothetical protein n=1 Tax=Novipirellula sp. TaxID=2795430 RepID=UPI0035676A5C
MTNQSIAASYGECAQGTRFTAGLINEDCTEKSWDRAAPTQDQTSVFLAEDASGAEVFAERDRERVPVEMTIFKNPGLTSIKAIYDTTVEVAICEIGSLIKEVHDNKLWKSDFDTFEECCKGVFRYSLAYSYRLIESHVMGVRLLKLVADEHGDFSPMGEKLLSGSFTKERQFRELKGIPQESLAEVASRSLEISEGKPPSSKQIRAAKVEVLGGSVMNHGHGEVWIDVTDPSDKVDTKNQEPSSEPKHKADSKPKPPTKPKTKPLLQQKVDPKRIAVRCRAAIESAMREADDYDDELHPADYEKVKSGLKDVWHAVDGWTYL